MSGKRRNHLSFIGVTTVAALALGLAAPAFAQRSADRKGTGEFGLQFMDFPGLKVDGAHGTSLDIGGDLAWGFSGAYNLTDRFALGGEMTWANPSYRATFQLDNVGGPVPRTVSASMDISTLMLKGTFNFLEGPLTPYAEVGAGWVYVDSNIANGAPSTGCWWDPWWGYVCSTFYDTYSDTRTTWTYAFGVRWDVSDSIALRLSYGEVDINTSQATHETKLDAWRGEIRWKF